jgi:hypothetical protein
LILLTIVSSLTDNTLSCAAQLGGSNCHEQLYTMLLFEWQLG